MKPIYYLMCVWLLCLPRIASANVRPDLNEEQIKILVHIEREARAQDIPPEIALAFAEVETMFQDKRSGRSYGPLQVDKSAVFPEDHTSLPRLSWNIKKGIAIIKANLARARGKTKNARFMYVCGPKFNASCSTGKIELIARRWASVAAKWGVKKVYALNSMRD